MTASHIEGAWQAVSLMFEAASPYSLAASPSNNEIAAAARALVVRLCAAEATRNCVVQVGAVPSLVQMLQVGSEDAKKSRHWSERCEMCDHRKCCGLRKLLSRHLKAIHCEPTKRGVLVSSHEYHRSKNNL